AAARRAAIFSRMVKVEHSFFYAGSGRRAAAPAFVVRFYNSTFRAKVKRGRNIGGREMGRQRPAGGLQAAPTSNGLCETRPERSVWREVRPAGSRPRPTG